MKNEPKPKILVTDASEMSHAVVRELMREGHEVVFARDVSIGVDLASSHDETRVVRLERERADVVTVTAPDIELQASYPLSRLPNFVGHNYSLTNATSRQASCLHNPLSNADQSKRLARQREIRERNAARREANAAFFA